MKIELIKLKFNDTHSYKYKPFKYCCDEIQNNKCIEFTNEDLSPLKHIDDGNFIPQFCISHTEIIRLYEDEWAQTDNYPIRFCPHCGDKIEISVIDEMDISDQYNELTKQREELREKCWKTDSKKEESALRERVEKLDKQIYSFYLLDEWKGETDEQKFGWILFQN